MKKQILILSILSILSLSAPAQTNAPNPAQNILQTVEDAISHLNTNSTVWASNSFTIYEGAAFSSVNGVPGQSSVGNDLGLTVPVLTLGKSADIHKSTTLALDSTTRFETVFGNVAHQQFGVLAQYNYCNVKFSGGLDVRYRFADNRLLAAPIIQVDYFIGSGPIGAYTRYEFPIQKESKAGAFVVGISMPFGK